MVSITNVINTFRRILRTILADSVWISRPIAEFANGRPTCLMEPVGRGAEMKEGPTMLMKTMDRKYGLGEGPTILMKTHPLITR